MNTSSVHKILLDAQCEAKRDASVGIPSAAVEAEHTSVRGIESTVASTLEERVGRIHKDSNI